MTVAYRDRVDAMADLEELVAEVVVRGDIALRPGHRVAVAPVTDGGDDRDTKHLGHPADVDLHPRAFAPDNCIQARLGRCHMLLHQLDEGVFDQVTNAWLVDATAVIGSKATDVIGPRWKPREGGSGPRYRRM